MPRQATPSLRRKWIGRRHGLLEKKMAIYEKRILNAAKMRTMEQAEAWLSTVSDEKSLRLAQRKVRKIVTEARQYAREWTKKTMRGATDAGIEVVKANARKAGYRLTKEQYTRAHAAAFNFSVEQLSTDMGLALGSISQKLNATFRKVHVAMKERAAIERIATKEVANKFVMVKSDSQVARSMFKRMRSKFTNTKGDLQLVRVQGPSGVPRNYNLRYYTKMVARTRVREAVTQGTKATALANGLDFVQVTAYGCDCDICAEFEDAIFSVSGGGELDSPNFQGALTDESEPPYHPNCTHSILPYVPAAAEVVKDPFGTFTEGAA